MRMTKLLSPKKQLINVWMQDVLSADNVFAWDTEHDPDSRA